MIEPIDAGSYAQPDWHALAAISMRSFRDLTTAKHEGEIDRWWLYRRVLADGRVLYLSELGGGMLCFGVSPDARSREYVESWYFESWLQGWRAAVLWEPPPFLYTPGPDEPFGWYRHPATARRRHNGDPAQEYIQR